MNKCQFGAEMKKEKLAIVSSHDDFCGIASYSRTLAKGLSNHFEVTIISLNVELLRKGDSKAANVHIKRICDQLKTFDCVSIQFEEGLFGTSIRSIKKRFFAIAKSCKKLTLTMHSYYDKVKYPSIVSLGKILLTGKLMNYIMDLKATYSSNRHLPLLNSIIRYCIKKNVPIIVHNKRVRELIEIKFKYNNVFDHPLCYYDQGHIQSISQMFTRKDFCQSLTLDENKTYIGLFGFISNSKGHATAIKALEHLPENYELLIFGAQHPHSIRLQESLNAYIESLLKIIETMKLSNRVKFHRSANDDDFLKFMIRCDFNVVPYLEVNQNASGIAALSLEANSKTICSQNHTFFELEKYAPNCFKIFTIGNHLELANAILSYRKSEYSSSLQEYHKRYNIHTSAELYKRLFAEV